ncbi:MAG: MFS transporter [Actinomycetota bacterium]|nr:MFS transporter [Actinomycetota bacterium]
MLQRNRLYHGWRVAWAGAWIQLLHGLLMVQAYGQYAVFLQDQFGWSKTTLSAGYTLNRVESGLLGPVQGWALQRFGLKRVMRLGVVLMAAGFVALSRINSVPTFFAALLLTSVGLSLSGFLSIVTAIVPWFERKRARALSVASFGFAVGGMFIPALVWFIEAFGWRTAFLVSGVLVLVLVYPLTSIFGTVPDDLDLPLDGVELAAPAFTAEGVSSLHFTAKEAFRTSAFWMISLGHAFALLVVGAVMAHLSLYLTTEHDYTKQGASFVTAGLTVTQLVGMLAGGFLGDRMSKRVLASAGMLGHMVGLLVLTFATSNLMIWLFVPLHGVAWGVRGPLMQALRADYFGSSSFGSIMGASSLILMFGTAGGPMVAGILADQTGDYRIGFTILAVMAGLGMIFFVFASPPKPPKRASP